MSYEYPYTRSLSYYIYTVGKNVLYLDPNRVIENEEKEHIIKRIISSNVFGGIFQRVYSSTHIDFPKLPGESTRSHILRFSNFANKLFADDKAGIKINIIDTAGLRLPNESSASFLARTKKLRYSAYVTVLTYVSPDLLSNKLPCPPNKISFTRPVESPTTHNVDEKTFNNLIGFIPK